MISQERLEQNRILMSKFLRRIDIDKEYRIDDPKDLFGYIYCITNLTNGKKYIGSCYSHYVGVIKPNPISQLQKRANQYLYEYNTAKDGRKSTQSMNRPIIKAMVEDGFENFIMYPIAETSKVNHMNLENFFIDKYDTIKSGYNVNKSFVVMDRIGRKLLAKDKLLRSEGIVAINVNDKKIIFSDSMKLFGDWMNSSKDMIKNSVRKGRPYKGWFIFYIDPDKRSYILNYYVLGEGLSKADRHSEKSKSYYQSLYNQISLYLMNGADKEYFKDFTRLDSLEYRE